MQAARFEEITILTVVALDPGVAQQEFASGFEIRK